MIKTKKLKVSLFVGLLACFIAIICCMQVAFGNSSDISDVEASNTNNVTDVNDVNSSDVNDVNDNKASANNVEQKSEKEMLGDRDLDSWELACEANRKEQTTFIAPEVEGKDQYTYHVKTKEDKTPNFNNLTITRGDYQFTFSYDYRGFFGNKAGELGRRANIQYFYDSSAKILRLVCFDGSEVGYNTYGYGLVYAGDTVFEDNIRYDDGVNYDIADNATSIILDPNIVNIKEWGFQHFKKLNTVDILGKLYNDCNLEKICDHSFRYCGENWSTVNVNFLESRFIDSKAYIDHSDDWAQDVGVFYDQPMIATAYGSNSSNEHKLYGLLGIENCLNGKIFGSDDHITINLTRDLNFNLQTLVINSNLKVTFNLNGHKIYSYKEGKGNTLFKVEGFMRLAGTDTSHGTVHQVNCSDPTIFVCKGGGCDTVLVDFTLPININGHGIPSKGGAFYFDDINSDSWFNKCSFKCIADDGGVFFINKNSSDENATIRFRDCLFNCCSATSKGGCVYNDAKHVKLHFFNTKFNLCDSHSDGGTIATVNDYEEVDLDYCTFESCMSYDNGGIIVNDSKNSTYTFNNTTVDKCHCNENGGAIASTNSYQTFTLNNCNIENCKSTGDGGALYSCSADSNYNFNDTKISSCHGDKGGAIATIKDHVKYNFDHSTIDSCVAENEGGAMYVRSCNCDITGTESSDVLPVMIYSKLRNTSTFSNNKSLGSLGGGGGIYTSNGTNCGNDVRIDHINFIGNYASNAGGCAFLMGDDNSVTNCLLKNNKALHVGGIDTYYLDGEHRHYGLKNCEFDSNKSTEECFDWELTKDIEYMEGGCSQNTLFWHNKQYSEHDAWKTGIHPGTSPNSHFHVVLV